MQDLVNTGSNHTATWLELCFAVLLQNMKEIHNDLEILSSGLDLEN